MPSFYASGLVNASGVTFAAPSDGTSGQILQTDGNGGLSFVDAAAGVTDHGDLDGLADDDHTQYLLVDGTRAMTGDLDLDGNDLDGVGDLDVDGDASFQNAAFGGSAVSANTVMYAAKNADDPTANQDGANFARNLQLTSANTYSITGGVFSAVTLGAAHNTTGWMRGGQFKMLHQTAATASKGAGAYAELYNVSTGTITDGYGLLAHIRNLNAAGTITRAYGLRVNLEFNLGTITNTYGVYIGDVTTGTQTNQAYGLYQADANARNYFAGDVVMAADVDFTGLPTSDPAVAGRLWNDSNTLKISAG